MFISAFTPSSTCWAEDDSLSFKSQTTFDSPSHRPTKSESAADGPTTINSLGSIVLDDATYLLTSPLRMDVANALVLGGVAAGIGGLMAADKEIRDFFQRNRDNTRNNIADGLEIGGSSYAFFGGHLGLIAGGYWFRETEAGDRLFRAAIVSLEAQMFTEATAGMVKIATGRRRPKKDRGTHSYKPFQGLSFDRSFPSSHAARAFAAAAVFADYYPQPVPLLAYSTASLIGLSRIFLDEHFASDVFAGAALGFAIGKTLSWRHRNPEAKWVMLPMLSGNGAQIGLTLHYTF